jgi:hypothetical protein
VHSNRAPESAFLAAGPNASPSTALKPQQECSDGAEIFENRANKASLARMARATCQAKQIPIWSRNEKVGFLGRTLFMPHGSSHYSLCSGALLEFMGGTGSWWPLLLMMPGAVGSYLAWRAAYGCWFSAQSCILRGFASHPELSR